MFFRMIELSALVIFYGVFINRIIMLRRAGIKAFKTAPGAERVKNILPVVIMFGFFIWSLELFFFSFLGYPANIFPYIMYIKLPRILPLMALGAVFVINGMYFIIRGAFEMGDSLRLASGNDRAGALVTGGIFSVSRHPLYLGIAQWFLGTALIYHNVFFAVSFISAALFMHLQALHEEKFLEGIYADGYREYQRKVRMYF